MLFELKKFFGIVSLSRDFWKLNKIKEISKSANS